MSNKRIRNFSIIAHIDHGKSTIADRLLEYTGTLSKRESKDQILDSMDLERERGITIKAKAIRLDYLASDGKHYILNLIDTPGHVDFNYEVSRSLAACEGTLLVIDASQGVEAQTLANADLASEGNLTVIPVINKIDLSTADPENVKHQINTILGLDEEDVIQTSAKQGTGIRELLEAIVKRIPAPGGHVSAPLTALVFDSVFDSYRGVIIYIKVVDGSMKPGMNIEFMSSGTQHEVQEIGVFHLTNVSCKSLEAGEVGYVIAGIKDVHTVKIGDTITNANKPATKALPGYKDVKPLVFCGLYPLNSSDYNLLKAALDKLRLNDTSFIYTPETSGTLGFGFRCGFLGLLHMDIIKERLEREYDLELIITAPNVSYHVTKKSGEEFVVDNPNLLPPSAEVDQIGEPYIKAILIMPGDYVGVVMQLAQERRGMFKDLKYIDTDRAMLVYEMPLEEVVVDFYDKLKSVSSGYASFDYEPLGYRKGDLVKLTVLINKEIIDSFCFILHKEKAYFKAKQLVERLRKIIPRQMFEVPIQALVNNKIVARDTVKALRKDVTSKCYGGDISRKRKLLEKQKEGKKKMKKVGKIEIPHEAFVSVLRQEITDK
ncbi:MAG: translation elongation factor 4 [bacterium]